MGRYDFRNHMKFLLYAQVDQSSIEKRLGAAEYSYFFLLRAFAGVLVELGEVVQLQDPAEADAIHASCQLQGKRCMLLSFAPPHKTPLGLACPTIPVFAWEYPNIPERIEEDCWQDDPRHDWRYVLSRTGRAITLSSHTVEAVRRSMGVNFPIVAIASPIKSIAHREERTRVPPPAEGILLRVNASVADSTRMGLDVNGLAYFDDDDGTPFYPHDLDDLPEPPLSVSRIAEAPALDPLDESVDQGESAPLNSGWDLPPIKRIRINLRGVVYTAVLAPAAGRKNWEDLISAFCWTFRDTEEATLVLKLTGTDLGFQHVRLLMLLTKLAPFKCRVIAISGYLSDEEYAGLVAATTYYVNTSLCEGLCLPLVEFLGEGIPAIAPDNTAMADYIRDDLAFVVDSYPGIPTVWPHGDNEVNRTSYHQLNWRSLTEAYRRSFEVANHDPTRYRQMSRRAREAMQEYCGTETVRSRLHAFLCPELSGLPHALLASKHLPLPEASPITA
jgi:glycosyltransferase involved in cell wall biosynthesis